MPNQGSHRPSRNEPLPPRLLQLSGLAMVVAQAVFWAITSRLEPTLLAMAGAMIGIGQYASAVRGLTHNDYPPDPLPPAREEPHPDAGSTPA